MGKGRRPCCDKASVKKGPWSAEEDLKLVSFIYKYGYSNWRALPKLAGLARCGKSCRLRWVNYLRPDLKRGSFTLQEEETIIKLHEVLGNKWSKIASHLPGRTDNEIKNIWNTHLKKRLKAKGSTISSPTSNDIMEHSSSSSTSHSSQINPILLDQRAINPNSYLVDHGANKDKDEDKIKRDVVDQEIVEIPFEPSLDMWDLLDGDSNSVQLNEFEAPLYTNSENDKGNHKVDGGSWWWLVYLENELGLDHNQSTLLQTTTDLSTVYQSK